MCSISGYGQDGPYKNRSGHDINYNALAGSLGMIGPAGEMKVAANPLKFSEGETKGDSRPPGFGEHTVEVLLDLGLEQDSISELSKKGVI